MPTPSLTDAELIRRLEHRSQFNTTREAAKAEGINSNTYDAQLQKARARFPQWGEKEGDPIDVVTDDLKGRVRDLEAQLAAVKRDNVTAKRIREMIGGLADELPEPPKWVVRSTKKGSPGVPLTLWSDWHVGEVVDKEQTGGINEFNLEIAQQRVRLLVEKIIDLCFNHQTNPDYPGIVVCLGGDMISGLIHQELVENMEGPFASQLFETYGLLKWALGTLADRFGQVFVVAVVGNHGRLWHKPRAKNRVHDSFEYLIYNFLRQSFCPTDSAGKRLPGYDDRLRFFIPDQTDAYFTVAGHRFLLTHGDSTGAKGGDGIIGALGPIVRGEKRVREVAGYVDDHYDTALMGHYHVKVSLDNVIVNPTLKGYDEFARNILRARPEVPAQMLLFVHEHYGIVDERRIFLEQKPTVEKSSSWVTWKDAA